MNASKGGVGDSSTKSEERRHLMLNMPSSRSKDNHTTDEMADVSFRRVSKYQNGQIVALSLAFVFSTGACLTLSYVNFVLSPDCLLFSKWTGLAEQAIHPGSHYSKLKKDSSSSSSSSSNNTSSVVITSHAGGHDSINGGGGWLLGDYDPNKSILDLNLLDTKWGKKRHCYVTQYGFAAAAVSSFILCWFFVFFRPTKEAYFLKKKTAASKLVLPTIIFCAAFVICVFVAAITLAMGIVSWCDSVSDTLTSCSAIRSYALTWASKTTYIDFFSVLIAGLVLAWLGALVWSINLITLAKRMYCHVDFPEYFFRPINSNNLQHENTVQSETDSD